MTHECRCTQRQILKYQQRVSGPLLDRIDIQVGVSAVPVKELTGLPAGEPSAVVRERVMAARRIQTERYRGMRGVFTNADAKSRDLNDICRLTEKAAEEIRRTLERLSLSARAYDRVLRVARTSADLRGDADVNENDIMDASGYRMLDMKFWT